MEQNVYKRLARTEAMANLQKSQLTEVLEKAYQAACASGDEQAAADAARAFRNRLLDLSDKEVSFDRLSMGTNDDIYASLLDEENLSVIEWMVYRQILRDIPEQKGFPFDITFPDLPNKDKQKEL